VRSAAAILPFLFVSTVTALVSQSPPAASPTARFLAAPPTLQSYRAWRRLEASNARFGQAGWLEVITELGPRGFEYRIEGVSTDSTANVRFAGRSVFTMRYVYQSINGHPIGG
jgi:hypothetical protein